MRAIYYSFNEDSLHSTIEIKDEVLHHLNVVRVRTGDSLLLLNGRGVKILAKVLSIDKKSALLEIYETIIESRPGQISLAIATPKKDAFEDILKMGVELGVASFQPLSSQYSQYDFVPGDRSDRLMESALIQSNNAWMPVISPQVSLIHFLKSNTTPLFFFNSQPVNDEKKLKMDLALPFTILIGPEGGFSAEETDLIMTHPHTSQVHLPTPILRAPTAASAAIGYLLALKSSS